MTTLFGGVCVCVTGVLLARGRNQNTTTHNKSMDACRGRPKMDGTDNGICGAKKQTYYTYQSTQVFISMEDDEYE